MILDDADLEHAVECAVFGSYYHQGQICMATNRVIVDASVHDEFVDRFVEQARALRVGDPRDPATQIGGTGNWRGRGPWSSDTGRSSWSSSMWGSPVRSRGSGGRRLLDCLRCSRGGIAVSRRWWSGSRSGRSTAISTG